MKKNAKNMPSTLEIMNKDAMNSQWSCESKLKLALAALEFFDVERMHKMAKLVPEIPLRSRTKGERLPFSVFEFCKFLEREQVFKRKPNHFRVQQVVSAMASHGMLIPAGHSEHVPAILNERYMYFRGLFGEHYQGNLWLAPVVGPELLYQEAIHGIVHITGTRNGEAKGATGLIVHQNHIVTCRHVVTRMRLDKFQHFQGETCELNASQIIEHATDDIALVRVNCSLIPLSGVVFRKPIVGQTVYTLGFPRLPNTRDASLTMQAGSVTNELVTSLKGDELFLYSAIARPGNSGGPIMSEDGYLIGLAVEDHIAQYGDAEPFSPHYAAIPADVVVRAVEQLVPDIQLVVSKLE